jgi:hypothetical protein
MGVYFMDIIGMYSIYEVYWKDMGALYFIDTIGMNLRYEAEIQILTKKHTITRRNHRHLDQDKAVQHQHKDGGESYQYCSTYTTNMAMDANTKTHGNYTALS